MDFTVHIADKSLVISQIN